MDPERAARKLERAMIRASRRHDVMIDAAGDVETPTVANCKFRFEPRSLTSEHTCSKSMPISSFTISLVSYTVLCQTSFGGPHLAGASSEVGRVACVRSGVKVGLDWFLAEG